MAGFGSISILWRALFLTGAGLALAGLSWVSPVTGFGFQLTGMVWLGLIALGLTAGGQYGGLACFLAAECALMIRILDYEQQTQLYMPAAVWMPALWLTAGYGLLGSFLKRPVAAGTAAVSLDEAQDLNWTYEPRRRDAKIEVKDCTEEYQLAAEQFANRIAAPLHEMASQLKMAAGDGEAGILRVLIGEQIATATARVARFREYLQPVKPTRHVVDINPIVESLVMIARHAAMNVRVDYLPAEKPLPVAIEPEVLRRMCLPALENAVTAAGVNGTVTVTTFQSLMKGGVEITDSGPGLAPAVREKIFQPYFSTRPGAEGLGLATVRRLARETGATLAIGAGTAGCGCRVRIEFPKAKLSRLRYDTGALSTAAAPPPTSH